MICKNYGTESRDDAKFCNKSGTAVVANNSKEALSKTSEKKFVKPEKSVKKSHLNSVKMT